MDVPGTLSRFSRASTIRSISSAVAEMAITAMQRKAQRILIHLMSTPKLHAVQRKSCNDLPLAPPPLTQLLRRRRPIGILKLKTFAQQLARHHSATLEDQFSFSADHPRPNLQHPFSGRETDPNSPRLPQHAHELRIRKRLGRRQVHGAIDIVMLEQPVNRANEILLVNPRDILPAITSAPTQSEAHQAQERVEYPA